MDSTSCAVVRAGEVSTFDELSFDDELQAVKVSNMLIKINNINNERFNANKHGSSVFIFIYSTQSQEIN